MHVGVIHTIRDRAGWDRVVQSLDLSTLPAGVELLSTGTAQDIDRAVCLWRAPSVEELQRMLDGLLDEAAVNDCFALAEDRTYLASSTAQAATV